MQPPSLAPFSIISTPERHLCGGALIVAPSLFATSSFFWSQGNYGVTGGTLLIFGSIAWILAFIGLFGALRPHTPRYAAWGLLFAIYGAVCGGVAFALQDIFATLNAVPHDATLRALAAHPFVANAIFWVGGPAFPLTLLILGIVLVRLRMVPWWVGTMLALGGALFPVARIPRLELIAHAVDCLMLIPGLYLGQRMWSGRFGDCRSSAARAVTP